MKKIVLLLLLGILPFSGFAQTDLVRWVTNNYAATLVNSNITADNMAVNGGVSLTANSYGPADTFFNTVTWEGTSTINLSKYIQFKANANSGFILNPTNFSFKARTTGGTPKMVVRYSKVADFSTYGTFNATPITVGTSYSTYTLDFPSNYASNPGGSIYVRVYVYGTYDPIHFGYNNGSSEGPLLKGTVSSSTILAVNDVVIVPKNTASDINVLNNDSPGSGTFISVGSLTTPTNSAGSVTVNPDNSVKFTPNFGFMGVSTFNYTATNSVGGTSQAQVQLTVTEPTLAEWGLISTSAVTAQQSYVSASALVFTDVAPFYTSSGMSLGQFANAEFGHYRYFELKIKPNGVNSVSLTNLLFEQQRIISSTFSGPTDYQIKYKIVTGLVTDDDYVFYNTALTLINGESIASNPIKDIPLSLTLTSTQTLVLRFYAKGASDWNTPSWLIKANTLKLRGNTPCVPQGNPATFTDDFWTGYAYTWTGSPAATTYLGYVEENESFDRNVNSGQIAGRGVNNGQSNLCAIPSDYFLVQYKMKKTFAAGSYSITVGGDDGYRLSLDGGTTWFLNSYTDHDYVTSTGLVCFDGTTPTNLMIEYYERTGNSRISFSYVAVGPATAPTLISGSTVACVGESITLTASGGTGNIYQWGTGTVGSNIISNASGASITVNFSGTTTYWVRRASSACDQSSYTSAVTKTVTLNTPAGDPSQFGINTWNVYAYNGVSFTPATANYFGYYTQNTLGCDTQDTANNGWIFTASPSSSAGWNGCQLPADNFTFVHKRRGFPSGSYQLNVRNYDDATRVFINGVQVRNYATWYGGSNAYDDDLGVFCFNENTTIEVITLENSDSANFKMTIVASNGVYANNAWNGNSDPSNKSVEIQSDLTVNSNLTLCSCTVKTGTTLTISANNSLTVIGDVIVEDTGKIIVNNNGSFIQVNENATFSGETTSFEMKRDTQPVFKYDYTYWSSPVKTDAGFKLVDLSPLTTPTRYMKWNHAATPQAWQVLLNGTEVMVPGRGYIVRAPATYNVEGSGAAQIYNANFIGHPNNGVITHAVTGSTDVNEDAYNLLGNPYPGALDAVKFLDENSQTLGGTLYFWTHNTEFATATNFSYSPSDYALWNRTGGTATTAGDENTNNNTSTPTGYIAAGQAFFVQGIGDGAGTVVFNNTMRTVGQNNQFFKPAPVQPVDNWQTTGKHRVWLNLTSTQNDFNQALVGYIENATNEMDRNFDGEVFSGGAVSLYSILDAKKLTIQGRALPFSNQDEVPLGYKTTLTGTLTISIDHVDGLFETQNIYIKDNVLNIVHNLKDSDYSFATVPGTFNDRFVLQYLSGENLDTQTPTIEANSMVVFNKNNQVSIKSSEHIIKHVEIYDMQGRLLFNQNDVNEQEFNTQNLNVNNQVIVVKITTDLNGKLVKKVIMN